MNRSGALRTLPAPSAVQRWSNSYINQRYALAFVLGLVAGLKVLPTILLPLAYVLLAATCLLFALRQQLTNLFCLLPYVIYGELYVRDSYVYFPYNFLPYFSILLFTVLLVQQKRTTGMHSRAFLFMAGYALLEFIDLGRALDLEYGWMLFTNSLFLALMSLWSASNWLSPQRINGFLFNIQITGIFTCGYLAVAHLTGHINYEHASNFTASNGLPPNQLSSYLGFPCILFAIAILRTSHNFLVHLACLVVSCTLMVFTFSRGGIYFLAAILFLYFLFNTQKARTYSILILLVPLAFGVFLYIYQATNGMLAERYEQPGYSGRDYLAKAALHLFMQNPVAGVGASNFNILITEENLYHVDSGAHNEIMRALAEHGTLGILTFWIFFAVLTAEILKRNKIQRDYAIYFLVLFVLTIVHNGLKTGLQPFILLLAMATPSVVWKKKHEQLPLIRKAPGDT